MVETQQFGAHTLQATIEKKRQSKEAIANSWSARSVRGILYAMLIFFPWSYGGVNYWAQFWVSLGLLVCLTIWWYDVSRDSEKTQTFPYLSIPLIGGILIGLIQLVPLPTFLAQLLLGKQIDIYQQFTGTPPVTAMATLFPQGTWHQLQHLLMAMAGLLIGARYFRTSKDVVILMTVVAANGTLLAGLGIIQKLTGTNLIPFNTASNFSSYVNRNNAAGYLLMTLACCVGLMPILLSIRNTSGPEPLISREMPYWRQLGQFISFQLAELNALKIALLSSVVLVASGVIASLSRGGSLALLVGLIVTAISYGIARRPRAMSLLLAPMVGLVLALSAWVGFSETLMKRWEKTEMVEISEFDARVKHWSSTLPVVQDMGLLGAGLGSYRYVHRLYNRENERVIFEYAENQYIQSLVEAGFPGLFLFLAAWLLGFYYSLLLLNRARSELMVGVGTMGVFLLSSQAVASLFDFGLYIPANMFTMAVLMGLVGYRAHSLTQRLKKNHWMNYRLPRILVQCCLLLLFAGLTMTALNLNRHHSIDQEVRKLRSGNWTPESLGLPQTDRSIRRMEQLVRKCAAVDGLNHLGDLWIHRFRLMAHEGVINMPEYTSSMKIADPKEQALLQQEGWNSTKPERVRDYIHYLNSEISVMRARAFVNQPALTENIPQAYQIFSYSRSRAPLQPYVHLRLGQLSGLRNNPADDQRGGDEIARAIELAPANSDFRLLGGVYYVQSGDFDRAIPQFKRLLELAPNNLNLVMQVLTGRTGYSSYQVPVVEIFENLLPEDPRILYQFARNWCQSDQETKIRALEKAENLIPQIPGPQLSRLALAVDIQLAKGETERGIETMQAILTGNPLDERTRFRLAGILLQEQRLTEALEHSETLVRSNRTNTSYTNLRRRIESEIRKKAESESQLNF